MINTDTTIKPGENPGVREDKAIPAPIATPIMLHL